MTTKRRHRRKKKKSAKRSLLAKTRARTSTGQFLAKGTKKKKKVAVATKQPKTKVVAFTRPVILAFYIYSDQYTHEHNLVGVYDNAKDAKKARDAGNGYVRTFKVTKMNANPIEMEEILR